MARLSIKNLLLTLRGERAACFRDKVERLRGLVANFHLSFGLDVPLLEFSWETYLSLRQHPQRHIFINVFCKESLAKLDRLYPRFVAIVECWRYGVRQ
jgi:hypothetical protein